MQTIISLVLVIMSVLCLTTGLIICAYENAVNKSRMNRTHVRIYFVMSFFAFLLCFGYGWMTGCGRDFDAAYIARSIALFGLMGFLPALVSLINQITNRSIHMRYITEAVSSISSVILWVLLLPRNLVSFTVTDFGTAYFARFDIIRVFLIVEIGLVFVYCMLFLFIWRRHVQYKRERVLIGIISGSLLLLIAGSAFDTVRQFLGMHSLPGSCFGIFLAVIIEGYFLFGDNIYNISSYNLRHYIYESISLPILIVNTKHQINLVNRFGLEYFGLSEKESFEKTISDLFDITQEDFQEIEKMITSRTGIRSIRLIEKKNKNICMLNISIIYDRFKEPICEICYVYDVTKETRALKELETVQSGLKEELKLKSSQMERVTLQAITTVANTIDSKDEHTRGHSLRVSEYSAAIAENLGWVKSSIQNIRYIALLHDIGKIGVPYEIINKPGKLSEEEYAQIKQHTLIGSEILKDIAMVDQIDVGARCHHERYDGTGYPYGLKGREIPLVGRIIAVADAYDAMTSKRVYREDLTHEQVMSELHNGRGTQFDPYIVDVFIKMLESGYHIERAVEESDEWTLAEEGTRLLQHIIKNQKDESNASSERDYLTGLWSRRSGEQKIRDAMNNDAGCLMVIDLDNLKRVNDSYGHISGDEALKTVADVLRTHEQNSIIARVGGDEFVFYLNSKMSMEEIEKIAEGIIYTYHSCRNKSDSLKTSSLSIGICMSERQADYTDIFAKADKALYFVKQNGKNGYYFYKADIGMGANNDAATELEKLVNIIRSEGTYKGVFHVEYREFSRIFDFVKKFADRNKQKIQLLMVSLSFPKEMENDIDGKEYAMNCMELAIRESLRSIDVSTRYSDTKFLTVLVNAKGENMKMITDRVFSKYHKMVDASDIEVSYDCKELY